MSINREEFLTILGVVSHLAHSDGEMHPAEKKVLMATFKAGKVTAEEQKQLKQNPSLGSMLAEVQSDEAKEALIDMLSLVAGADGEFQDEERVFMFKVMQKLGVDPNTHPYFKDGQNLDIKLVRSNVVKILENIKNISA
jgi:tellurite resistance protein